MTSQCNLTKHIERHAFVLTFVLLAGCASPIKVYEGPESGRENTARIRAIAVDDGGIEHERKICFEAQRGKTYEIEVTSENGVRSCREEVVYRLVDAASGSTMGAFQSDSCQLSHESW